jgi:quercetin dioxygenase-like cupin family protein
MASPDPRVVVTSHDAAGKSIFSSDNSLEPFAPFGPSKSSFSVFDVRSSVPVSNQEAQSEDYSHSIPRCPPEGVLFGITNFPPHYTVPMHRTLSLDYCIVVSGEIAIELDGGEEKTVKAGDFIVQGGVNHRWRNRGDEVCRVCFVMVGSQKVELEDGSKLEETVITKEMVFSQD